MLILIHMAIKYSTNINLIHMGINVVATLI